MTPPLPPSFYHSLETFVWVLFESLFNLSHQNNLDLNNTFRLNVRNLCGDLSRYGRKNFYKLHAFTCNPEFQDAVHEHKIFYMRTNKEIP